MSGSVDVDDLEIQILILAKKAEAMNQAGAFLSRRGWPTTILSSLGEAIQFILKERPDFVLISLNHPNPKLLKLPPLLKNTLNIQCIGFAEKADALTLERLNKAHFDHKIGGFASGPSVQRAIRKILTDIYNPSPTGENETSGSLGDKPSESQSLIIQGSAPSNYDTVHSENYSLHTQKVRRRLKDLPPPSSTHLSENKPSTLDGSSGSQSQDNQDTQALLALLGEEPGNESIRAQHRSTNTSPKGGTGSSAGKSSDKAPLRQSQEKKAVNNSVRPKTSLSSQRGLPQPGQGEAAPSPLILSNPYPARDPNESENLLSELLSSALDRVGEEPKEGSLAGDLSQMNCLGILPIEGIGLQGYVVIGQSGPPYEVSEKFLWDLRDALIQSLLAKDLVADVSQSFSMKTPPLSFEAWLQSSSPFTLSSHFNHQLVRVGFIPSPDPLPKLKRSRDREMLLVAVEHLSPQTAVEFKAYLHLQKNGKYFLYLKEDRHLLEQQKERLMQKNVHSLAIRQEDADKFRVYSAKSFLTGSLKDFRLQTTQAYKKKTS